MSLIRRIRVPQLIAAAVSVLLSTSIAASAATLPYGGAITFGAPTVSRTCSGTTPRSVAISVPFNASHLTAPLTRLFYANFIYAGKTVGWIVPATPAPVTIRPKQVGLISHRFTISTNRSFNIVEIGLLDQRARHQQLGPHVNVDAHPVDRPRRELGPLAPHNSRTVRIGIASRGADRFTLSASAASGTTSATVALIDFSEGCTRSGSVAR